MLKRNKKSWLVAILCILHMTLLKACKNADKGNENIAIEGKNEMIFQKAFYSQFNPYNIYPDSLLRMKIELPLLNDEGGTQKLGELIRDKNVVIFSFSSNTSCASCVNNEFIELKEKENKNLFKLVIILDNCSIEDIKAVKSRFKREVYCMPLNESLLPINYESSYPLVLHVQNSKIVHYFILGLESKRYVSIFNDYLERYIKSAI